MVKTSSNFYSYLFQEEEGITAAYFKTKTGTEYRVYFYPIHETFDFLNSETLIYHTGFFFGFTKLKPNEDKKEPIDFCIRNTILIFIQEFFEEKGIDKVLVFYCDDGDGKKLKRFSCFESWYSSLAESKTCYKKFDEEIILTDEHGNKIDVDYLSLIIECNNPMQDRLIFEFQSLKEDLISNK
jgi:hypothetical protein